MGNIAQEPLKRISLIGNMFGHPIRLLVLRVVESSDGATWTQIKSAVEETYGPVNPNTLNFHLTKLVQGDVLHREGQDIYKIAIDSPVLRTALEQLVE